jgi:hypothetical protein
MLTLIYGHEKHISSALKTPAMAENPSKTKTPGFVNSWNTFFLVNSRVPENTPYITKSA